MERYAVALIGGDARTAYMQSYLLEKKYQVTGYGLTMVSCEAESNVRQAKSLEDALKDARIIIGGIPFLKEGKMNAGQKLPDLDIDNLYRNLKKGQSVFGGVIPESFVEQCEEKGVHCHDFMKDEGLAVFNAIATAEGTILEALRNNDTNIHGSESLVIGYGRCGRVLAGKLKGMGAKVTICCRRQEALEHAYADGMQIILLEELAKQVHRYTYVYNTVPALVLGKHILTRMRRDVLVVDIASKPGGVDREVADQLGIKALHCLGLPGKYAPKISAQALAEYVSRVD